MRPRVVLPALIAAVVFIVVLISLQSRQRQRADSIEDPKTMASAPNSPLPSDNVGATRASTPSTASSPTPVITTPAPALELSDEERAGQDQIVSERISALNEWAASDDTNNLRQILLELDNPEPRIREAAVQAAVQFKSPDAIPALRDSLDRATELDEKVAIRDAIEFLTPDVATVNP